MGRQERERPAASGEWDPLPGAERGKEPERGAPLRARSARRDCANQGLNGANNGLSPRCKSSPKSTECFLEFRSAAALRSAYRAVSTKPSKWSRTHPPAPDGA